MKEANSLLVIISTTISVLILMAFALIPFFILRRNDQFGRRRGIFRSGTLSLCNCFAAGVFLATCFLGLVPHTTLIGNQINERLFSQDDHKHSHNELGTTTNSNNDGHLHLHERNTWLQILFDPNLMILIGFLFTLFVEQMVDFHQSTQIHTNAAHRLCDLSARSCHKQIEPNKGPQQVAPTRLRSNPLSGSSNGKETVPMSVRVSSPDDQDSDANETTLLTGQITVANEGVSEISNNNFNADASETDAIIKFRNSGRKNSLKGGRQGMEKGSSKMRSVLLLLAMSTHSFFEGIALGAQQASFGQFLRLLVSIMLHEVLCAFAYGLSLARQRSASTIFWAIFSSFLLSASIPFGMFVMTLLGALENESYSLIIRFVLEGLAAGIFIYVACLEMLAHEFSPHSHSHNEPNEEHHHHHGDPVKAGVVILGGMVSFAVNAFIGH